MWGGGLGKLMMLDKMATNRKSGSVTKETPARVGDLMCCVYNERLFRFEPLALNSRSHIVQNSGAGEDATS